MLNEIFLSLFAVTFLVAVVAFSAYGYLLFTLLKHRSEKLRPNSTLEFITFLWKLLIYYIQRALSGFFDIKVGQKLDFIKTYDGEIKDAESNRGRMISAYRLFSTAYILFFILIVCLILVFIYMVAGPYL
jgi:uncharacterized protein with PQ loop repeat